MPLGIFDEGGRVIKAHRLVVEQSGREGRQVVALQIGAGIGDDRKAGRVGFWKSVPGERGDE